MNRESPLSGPISDELIEDVCARLGEDRRVRRTLGKDGRLNIDRRVPFLCVYRPPPGQSDAGTRQLVKAEAAYLIAPSDRSARGRVSRLVQRIVETATDRFGAFLIVEVFAAPEEAPEAFRDPHSGELLIPRPEFRILARREPNAPLRTLSTLQQALGKIRIHRQSADVQKDHQAAPHPPNMKPLIPAKTAQRIGCCVVGLEVRPIYRDPETGELFPGTLRRMRRGLGRVLKQAFFTFAHSRTNIRPQHYYALGRRKLVKAVWEVDRQLAEISDSFDFLLQTTPVNVEAAWRAFRRKRFEKAPTFHYRPLAVEPALLKRRLYEIPVERIEDPTIAHIFRQKQDELDRKITMLADIETRRFLWGSLQLYGEVRPSLLNLAHEILQAISPHSREGSRGKSLSAPQFAERARAEIEHYRQNYPEFRASVIVRDDMYSGLLVSNGDLLIGQQTSIAPSRVEALLQHEIGTHALTYHNALSQPLRQLHTGLAGYDGLQEGLAVLAEYLVGGLSRPRLRLLAARVVAVHQLIEGASFVETFRLLDKTYEFPQRTAYTITMRVYRGGGLTKDSVYLRGLVEILDYLHNGGDLDLLFVGKMAADHVPVMRELLHRQVLHPPPIRPRYMECAHVDEKLAQLRRGATVLDLLQ